METRIATLLDLSDLDLTGVAVAADEAATGLAAVAPTNAATAFDAAATGAKSGCGCCGSCCNPRPTRTLPGSTQMTH